MTRLYNYMVAAPRNQWTFYRGYDKVLLYQGVYTWLQPHRDRVKECPALGLCIGHPGGKDRDLVFWRDGTTGMRSDQMKRAYTDPLGAVICRAIMEHVPDGTILYVGGHPKDLTVGDCGLIPYAKKFGLAFDAMSSQSDLSILAASAVGLMKQGRQCWTEANDVNRQTDTMPIIAAPIPWRKADEGKPRTRMEDAPPGSIYWWRGYELDKEPAWAEWKRALAAGLSLCLRLEQLDASQRKVVYRMVGD